MRSTLLVALLTTASGNALAQPVAGPSCGNGKVDLAQSAPKCPPCVHGNHCPCVTEMVPIEACDGADLGGHTCQSEGAWRGSLSCTAACTLDTSGCAKLASKLPLRHLAMGAAPPAVSLTFMSNVLWVVTHGATSTTATPYNYDLRGPWGKGQTIAATKTAIFGGPATELAEQHGADVELYGLGTNGEHVLGPKIANAQLVTGTQSWQGGTVIGTRRGSRDVLSLIATNWQGAPIEVDVEGELRSVIAHPDGFVVASVKGGQLHLRVLGAGLAEVGRAAMKAPSSFAIAPSKDGFVLVYGDGRATYAVTRKRDAKLTASTPIRVTSKPARVVGATAESSRGLFHAVLDDGVGTISIAKLETARATVTTQTIVSMRTAKALATTLGQERMFVAWTVDRELYVSSYVP